MSTLILTRSGGTYFSSVEVEETKAAIDRGELIPIWWFAPWGQRFHEKAWFAPDTVELIRSESDD